MNVLKSLLAVASLLCLSNLVSANELKPISRVEPAYPADALRSGVKGFVEIEFTVDKNGIVESVSVVNAKPSRVFERSAVTAVKQWTFAPGGGRGKVMLDFAP